MFSLCSACHEKFNDSDLLEFDNLPFCKDHHNALKSSELKTIESVTTSPSRPDLSVALHDKQVALIKKGTISYIKMSYTQKGDEILTKMDLISI